MKAVALFTFLCCIPAVFAAEANKRAADYIIVKSSPDKTVPKGKSKMEFNVYAGRSVIMQQQLISYSIDGQEGTVTTDASGSFSLLLNAGEHVFQYFLTGDYYEITTSAIPAKSGYHTVVNLYFQYAYELQQAEKPVIYCYPEKETGLSVQLQVNGQLGFTYPAYENGWNVTAKPDGTIVKDSTEYPYLFWEADVQPLPQSIDGFIVPADQVTAFLERQLTHIGLNSKEKTDFITYWAPRMVSKGQVFIRFSWGKETDHFARLAISPTPDHLNRLYMIWSPIPANVKFTELPNSQELPVFDRSGFDVLEWGGVQTAFSQML